MLDEKPQPNETSAPDHEAESELDTERYKEGQERVDIDDEKKQFILEKIEESRPLREAVDRVLDDLPEEERVANGEPETVDSLMGIQKLRKKLQKCEQKGTFQDFPFSIVFEGISSESDQDNIKEKYLDEASQLIEDIQDASTDNGSTPLVSINAAGADKKLKEIIKEKTGHITGVGYRRGWYDTFPEEHINIGEVMNGNAFETARIIHDFKESQFREFYYKMIDLLENKEKMLDGVVLPARSALHWGNMLNGFRAELRREFSEQKVDVPTSQPVWQKVKKGTQRTESQVTEEVINEFKERVRKSYTGKEIQLAIFDESVNTGTTRHALKSIAGIANKEMEDFDIQKQDISSLGMDPGGSYPTWVYDKKDVTMRSSGEKNTVGKITRPSYDKAPLEHELHRLSTKLAREAGIVFAQEVLNNNDELSQVTKELFVKDSDNLEN